MFFGVSLNSNWHVKAPTKTIIISPEQDKGGKKRDNKSVEECWETILDVISQHEQEKTFFSIHKAIDSMVIDR